MKSVMKSVTTLIAALSILVLASFGCRPNESEPVSVARTFAEAVRRGDVDGMLAVVEHPAVDHLELVAERAGDQVGGRRGIEASEMLQIVGVDRTVAVADAELLEDDGERARVELTMTDGRTVRLELVWEQAIAGGDDSPARAGGWKVRIPLPSSPTLDADPLAPGVQPSGA
ncbi:hypothetical protein ENSA5_06590 [Enhygromyxa salina]|uniref:Nuclear transport factor 2 family protein n=1 Tax=Enhygromyxa salina TaxID=215803 RepID=A0A2S9YHD9_9BACT|nr:hypothetical protein [Enhygromyxa salina]PRQ04535.1 hypothetical protein ENSA5_06590 [Enhygromyxa salina]